jgi:CheY-like chemotaxis protein/tetratricopeptide (TPR) repeat protein
MAQYVLIVEDDDGVSKAMAELCAGLGLEIGQAKTGPAAIQALRSRPADLILLDLLLPGGMDGSKVAEQVREANPNVPIVVVSGFIKDPKAQRDLQTRFNIKTFLQKPMRADELTVAVKVALGLGHSPTRPGGSTSASTERAGMDSFEVELGLKSPLAIFVELQRAKAEGVLDLTKGQVKKRFWIQRGFFRYATSNVKGENLSGLLQAKGVAEDKINQALQMAKSGGMSIPDAMVKMGLVTQKDLPALLTQQTEEVAITATPWTEGLATFKANPLEPGVEGRANPALCILKAVKRYVQPDAARKQLLVYKDELPQRTPELDREMFAIKNLFPGEVVSPMINGRSTVTDLLARIKRPEDVVLLHALVTSGLAKANVTALGIDKSPSQTNLPAVTPSKPKRPYTHEEEVSRQIIQEESRRQAKCTTHYQILGVASTADLSEIKAAYLKMARTYHTDAFAGQELGEMGPALNEIFKRITEANENISEPEKRADYDTLLDRKAKGLPTDVDQLLRADNAFNRAEALRKAGQLKNAEKFYREAYALNAGEPNYLLALAKTINTLQGKAVGKELLELIDKGLAAAPDSMALLVLKAQTQLAQGNTKQALDTIRKVTSVNPNFENAMDVLREAKNAVRGNTGESEKVGLLGKLFGNKGK